MGAKKSKGGAGGASTGTASEDAAAAARAIVTQLEQQQNDERREVAARYFPSSMRHIGVAMPDVRVVLREVLRQRRGDEADAVRALAGALIAEQAFEAQLFAFELLAKHRATRDVLRARELEQLGKGNDNWCSVDTFANMLSGPAWREGRISDATITRWARSTSRWWRRAALVSTVPLNQVSKGGAGDVARTLAVCEMLAGDGDDMVVKALSWALRALIVHDAAAVEAFLATHEDVIAARARREVRNKLTTGRKSGK